MGYVIQWRRTELLCEGQLQGQQPDRQTYEMASCKAIWDILQAWTGDRLNLLGLVSKAGIKPFCSTKAFH